MKHRQRVQVNIAVTDTRLPAKDCRVDPQVAVRHLDTFGPCRGATGVVDRGGRVFVPLPIGRLRDRSRYSCSSVGDPISIDPCIFQTAKGFHQFRIDQGDLGARVIDDVLDFDSIEPEVDSVRRLVPNPSLRIGIQAFAKSFAR